MGNIYIGNGGIARKSSKIYVGVNGIARQAQKIYVGDVNGKAREVYSAWSPVIYKGKRGTTKIYNQDYYYYYPIAYISRSEAQIGYNKGYTDLICELNTNRGGSTCSSLHYPDYPDGINNWVYSYSSDGFTNPATGLYIATTITLERIFTVEWGNDWYDQRDYGYIDQLGFTASDQYNSYPNIIYTFRFAKLDKSTSPWSYTY